MSETCATCGVPVYGAHWCSEVCRREWGMAPVTIVNLEDIGLTKEDIDRILMEKRSAT